MKLDREKLLNHIDDEEKILELKKVIDKIEIVLNDHIIVTTDFLDPYEIKLSKSILNRFNEISYIVDGGYCKAERTVIYIFPEYIYEPEFLHISILRISKKSDFEHKDVLGSIIGLGVDRRKIGDILFGEESCFLFVKSEISDFLEFNLKKIAKNNVTLEKTDSVIVPDIEYESSKLIISSLRLDAFIGGALKLSRTKAQELISHDKVKVNFKNENKCAFILNEGDLISVRKFGRFIFDSIDGSTKKDKYVINIKIPK